MTEYKNIIIGNVIFLISFFFLAITQYIIPPLTDFLSPTLSGVVWTGTIIVATVATIILPSAFIYMGLTQGEEKENKFLEITIAIIHVIITIILMYLSWYAMTPLAGALTITLYKALFWTGLVIIYTANLIVIPAYLAIQAKNN